MRGDEGYTLAEMMAGLLVLGLAIGGLGQGVRVLARYQGATTAVVERTTSLETVRREMAGMIGSASEAGKLTGTATGFQTPCAPQPCAAVLGREAGEEALILTVGGERISLPLPPGGAYRLAYLAADGRHETWPAAETPADRLRGVGLFAGGDDLPAAYVAVREEQSMRCEYDVIGAACREAGS